MADSFPNVSRATLGLRLVAICLLVPASYYIFVCLPFSFLPLSDQPWVPIAISLVWAALAGWLVYTKLERSRPAPLLNMLTGATVAASFALSLAFLGPIFLMPNPDIAPLIGLALVVPLSFLFGGFIGFLGWSLR